MRVVSTNVLMLHIHKVCIAQCRSCTAGRRIWHGAQTATGAERARRQKRRGSSEQQVRTWLRDHARSRRRDRAVLGGNASCGDPGWQEAEGRVNGGGVATRTRGGSVVSSGTATRGGGGEGTGTQGYPRVGVGTPERRSARRFLLGLDVFERGAGGESERGESGCGGRRRRRSRRRIPGSQSERNLASEKQERKPSRARSRVGLKHAWRPRGEDSA